MTQTMLDTTGPELFINNKSGKSIELKAGAYVTLGADTGEVASNERLPLNYDALAKVIYYFIIMNVLYYEPC